MKKETSALDRLVSRLARIMIDEVIGRLISLPLRPLPNLDTILLPTGLSMYLMPTPMPW